MKNPKTIKCFIPAIALEHPQNGEFFTRREKIVAAVNRRLRLYGKTKSDIYVFLKNVEFNPEPLGYDVEVICS